MAAVDAFAVGCWCLALQRCRARADVLMGWNGCMALCLSVHAADVGLFWLGLGCEAMLHEARVIAIWGFQALGGLRWEVGMASWCFRFIPCARN